MMEKTKTLHLEVPLDATGLRLDRFLSESLPELSAAACKP